MAKQADVLMLLGRAFRKVAAATTTELSPAFTCVRTTVNKLLFAECNALAGLYGHTRSVKVGMSNFFIRVSDHVLVFVVSWSLSVGLGDVT